MFQKYVNSSGRNNRNTNTIRFNYLTQQKQQQQKHSRQNRKI